MKGKTVKIWEGGFKDSHTLGGGFGIEGSHMYRINDMYYITCPAGGTQGWEICLRSKHIYGPYENHLIMDDDSSYPDNGLHQGGMVQLKLRQVGLSLLALWLLQTNSTIISRMLATL